MNVTDQFQICLVQFLIIDRTWNWSEIIFFLFHIFKFNIYIYVYICISYTTTSIEQLVRTKTPNSEVTSLNLLQGNSPQLNSSLSRVKAGPIQSSFFFFFNLEKQITKWWKIRRKGSWPIWANRLSTKWPVAKWAFFCGVSHFAFNSTSHHCP